MQQFIMFITCSLRISLFIYRCWLLKLANNLKNFLMKCLKSVYGIPQSQLKLAKVVIIRYFCYFISISFAIFYGIDSITPLGAVILTICFCRLRLSKSEGIYLWPAGGGWRTHMFPLPLLTNCTFCQTNQPLNRQPLVCKVISRFYVCGLGLSSPCVLNTLYLVFLPISECQELCVYV